MVCNNVTRKKSIDPDLKWAKHTIHNILWTIRKTLKLYEFRMDESDRLYCARHKFRRSKKKKRVDFTQKKLKYGMEKPRHVKKYLGIDIKWKDTKWRDSMALEIDSLIDIDCFEFKPVSTEPPDSEYHSTKLHCVFSTKHDIRRMILWQTSNH